MPEKQVKSAIKLLKQGKVVIFPTDTAYGLGCKFNSRAGINKILKLKKRTDRKFTVVASSLNQVQKYFKLTSAQIKYVKQYWPGPLSLVVNNQFAVRVPDNLLTRKLAQAAGCPLIATSCNFTGKKTIYDLKDLELDQQRIDYIIDAGRLKKQKTSKVVKLENNQIIIIRK